MIPNFRYHPEPITTGNVKPGDTVCQCCGQNRGYIYTGPVYSPETLDDVICPFCIADGSAAEKFQATFSDAHPLAEAGVPEQVIDEVTKRTPGYVSWQQDVWLVCCGDACEFHGDAPKAELGGLDDETLEELLSDIEWDESEWDEFVTHYEPGGDPAFYKFVCRHCKRPRYGMDCS